MAYVTVPKDLDKVKNKVVFNLTMRQVVCIAAAAVIGVPVYFLTKEFLGTSNAATVMVIMMLPAFFFALYEKDGLPLEVVLMNMIRVRFLRPQVRRAARQKEEEVEEQFSEFNEVTGIDLADIYDEQAEDFEESGSYDPDEVRLGEIDLYEPADMGINDYKPYEPADTGGEDDGSYEPEKLVEGLSDTQSEEPVATPLVDLREALDEEQEMNEYYNHLAEYQFQPMEEAKQENAILPDLEGQMQKDANIQPSPIQYVPFNPHEAYLNSLLEELGVRQA